MTNEEFDEIKKDYVKKIKDYLIEEGGIPAHFTLFADHKKEQKPAIVHIPIPNKFLADEKGKDLFVDEIVPELVKEVRKRFDVVAVAWVSEAWMRNADKSIKEAMESPIKREVLIISIEGAFGEQLNIYEMKRSGMEVNESGSMIDHIDLIELPEYGSSNPEISTGAGRFQGIYKKFTQNPD